MRSDRRLGPGRPRKQYLERCSEYYVTAQPALAAIAFTRWNRYLHRMTARRFAFTTATLTAVTLVALALTLLPRSRGVSEADFKLLKPGMTWAEVERLLAGPPRNDVPYESIVWIPHADGTRRSARLGPGAPGLAFHVAEHFRDRAPNEFPARSAADFWYFSGKAPEEGRQEIWATETGLIAVYFGQDGRLEQKYFSTVHVTRPPTVMDWIASRPRQIRRSLGR
jgi:hypothetical protein